MTAQYEEFRIEPDDFTRRFAMRWQTLMWFLGAGASASAGVPTAFNGVWDFKRQLCITQTKVAPQAVSGLSILPSEAEFKTTSTLLVDFPYLGSPMSMPSYSKRYIQLRQTEDDTWTRNSWERSHLLGI